MKCSVYIATSVDGFIADAGGGLDWLDKAGIPDVDMGKHADMGWRDFMASIDCVIMGRNSMETVSNMNLKPEQWPYGETKIMVLSTTLKEAPENMRGKVELHSGSIKALISKLESEGFKHAYIDGGKTIQAFLNLKLIHEITLTRAPVLLGEGIPLFGKTFKHIRLENAKAIAFPNDFIQVNYRVKYD